jgi:hypothetical protein
MAQTFYWFGTRDARVSDHFKEEAAYHKSIHVKMLEGEEARVKGLNDNVLMLGKTYHRSR